MSTPVCWRTVPKWMHAAEGRTDRSRCRHDVTLERWDPTLSPVAAAVASRMSEREFVARGVALVCDVDPFVDPHLKFCLHVELHGATILEFERNLVRLPKKIGFDPCRLTESDIFFHLACAVRRPSRRSRSLPAAKSSMASRIAVRLGSP